MSYTPGPWEYNARTGDIEHRSDTLYGIVAKYVHQCNVPIIVAAPDMAESLRKLVVHCTNYASYLKTLGPEFKETYKRVQDDIDEAASTLRLINGTE